MTGWVIVVLVGVALAVFAWRWHTVGPEFEEEDAAPGAFFVFVRIPDPLMPEERVRRYGDPLDAALKQAGLGEVTGGGSPLGEPDAQGNPVAWVGLDVDLVDLERGLPQLRQDLRRLGAPPRTVLEFERDGQRVSETLGHGN